MHSQAAMKPPALVEKSDGIPSAESDIEVLCVKKGEENCVQKDDTATSKSDTMIDSDVTALKDNDVDNHSDTTENESSSDGLKGNNCYKTKKTEGESNSDVILLNDASHTTEKEVQAEERTESEVEESARLSPDECSVKISNKKLTVVDKPPRLRSETRGQYMCQLALQFTHNQHKKVTETPLQIESKDSILYVIFHNFVSDFNTSLVTAVTSI